MSDDTTKKKSKSAAKAGEDTKKLDAKREKKRARKARKRAAQDTPKKQLSKPKDKRTTSVERPRLILVGTWVTLGHDDQIPEILRGHDAYITEAPMMSSDGDEVYPHRYQYQDEETTFTYRTRDEYSATGQCTRDGFSRISWDGRAGLASAG
jgi:hypothetical protein